MKHSLYRGFCVKLAAIPSSLATSRVVLKAKNRRARRGVSLSEMVDDGGKTSWRARL